MARHTFGSQRTTCCRLLSLSTLQILVIQRGLSELAVSNYLLSQLTSHKLIFPSYFLTKNIIFPPFLKTKRSTHPLEEQLLNIPNTE